jgi:U3 small nucleolar ribonucleoprotein component
MEKLRKKNQTETKNRVEVNSSRLEQVEDRISEFKDEIEIKEKIEEILVKQLKSCEWNMQEHSYSNKRPNLRIMSIEEGEEVQAKGIHNILNKIITENFTNLKKALHRNHPGHQTDLTKIEPSHNILSLKQKAQRTEKEY